MNPEKKSRGAFLAAGGSIGIILIILFGPPDLGRPYNVVIGFVFGIIVG